MEGNIPQRFRQDFVEDKKRKQILEAWLAPHIEDDDLESLQYEPIPPGDAHMVRLVQLLPGKDWEPIEVTLDFSTLDVEYDALSYCWGDVSKRSPVVCNGKRLFVTPNLKSALRDLRLPDSPRLLWIDAIAINQADINEREQQVGIMHEIYSRAQQTIIWLGETFFGNNSAFAMLQRVYDLYYDKVVDGEFDTSAVLFQDVPIPTIEKESMPTEDEMYALLQLLKKDWWHRVWVIQEVSLAQSATIICGNMEMEWDTFWGGSLVAFLMGWHGTQSRTTSFNNLFAFKYSRDAAQYDHESKELDLLVMLRSFRQFSATDPRDKVFALYGMTNSSLNDMDLTVNYRAKVEDIYVDVAKGIVKTCDTLDILSISKSRSDLAKRLPSWVPDWSDSSEQLHSYFAREDVESDEHPITPFNATGSSTVPPPTISPTNRLTLRGYRLDIVKTLSRAVPDSLFDFEVLQSRSSTVTQSGRGLRALYSYAYSALNETASQQGVFVDIDAMVLGNHQERAQDKYAPTGESLESALVRTLTGDFAPQGLDFTIEAYKLWRRERWAHAIMRKVKINRLPKLYSNLSVAATLLPSLSDTQAFASMIEEALGRRLCWTNQEHIAMVPPDTQTGDEVWLIQGCRMPIILRSVGDFQGARELVGDSYVHGVMYGEAFDLARCSDVTLI